MKAAGAWRLKRARARVVVTKPLPPLLWRNIQMAIPLVERYKDAIIRLSARTGASVPSLCASFLILHEITAIVPFIGVFYASRGLGVGEKVIDLVLDNDENTTRASEPGWVRAKTRQWVDEGGRFAERVGGRYGIFGFEKRSPGLVVSPTTDDPAASSLKGKVVGDVANAVVAYGVVKVRPSSRISFTVPNVPARPFSRYGWACRYTSLHPSLA